MTNTTVDQYPAIGACFDCRQVFLVSDSFTRCLLCGRPPGALLPFALSVGAPLAAPEEPPPPVDVPPITALAPLQCPHCGESFQVRTSDAHVFVIPLSPPPPAEEAATVPASTTAAAPSPDETPPAAPEEPLP